MSLKAIVSALGGELYDQGRRALVPGPGHSRHDRSVSLLLTGDRLVVHSFGRSTWREVFDALRARGLVDGHGRVSSGQSEGWSQAPARPGALRTTAATTLWSQAAPLSRQLSVTHLRRRGIDRTPPVSAALRHHSSVASAVYANHGVRRPALLAEISNAAGDLCAVEVTYLDLSGSRASGLAVPRKVIGVLPPSSAVRLDDPSDQLLVGEGVFTTLSAAEHFKLPGWALLSTGNLRSWRPPEGVRRVLIAADRGDDGERSARALRQRLQARGVDAGIAWPRAPASDWNEACATSRSGEGRAGKGAPGGRVVRSSAPDQSS